MIPIEKEPKELFKEFGFYEKCYFCKKTTDTWHEETNTCVCRNCSKTHDASEIQKKQKSNIGTQKSPFGIGA